MATALIASIAVFVAAVVVGFAVKRRVGSDAKLEGLPWYLQLLVGGLAIIPVLHFEDQITVGPIDGVTLLRVGDADGRRIHTGEVRCVESATLDSGFEAAMDSDAGLSPTATLRNTAQWLYWSVRRLLP